MKRSMPAERWQRLKSLFDQLVALAPEQRDCPARELCGGDEALYRDVIELLADHDRAVENGFLDSLGGNRRDGGETTSAETTSAAANKPKSTLGLGETFPFCAFDATALPPALTEKFEIIAEIGRGGMGHVYKAKDRMLGRVVAIKRPRYVYDEQVNRRSLEEARAAAQLHHPSLCAIHSVEMIDDGPIIVMEYVDGVDLDKWRAAHQPSPKRSAEIVADLAEAVEYAHQHNVVHRDIKPANIIVREADEQAVLTDFGLAKRFMADRPEMTETGLVMGTPAYMSPEQASGEPNSVGPATDIYALGGVLYFLLCARPPFEGSQFEILQKLVDVEPPRPRRLNAKIANDLETISLKALRKDPLERYLSAAEMAADLRRFVSGEAILARREPRWRTTWRRIKRNRVPVAVSTAIIALCLVAVAWSIIAGRQASAIAQATADLNALIENTTWTETEHQRIDEGLRRLSRSEAMLGQQQTELYRKRYADHIRGLIIDPPALGEAEIAAITSKIPWKNILGPVDQREFRKLLSSRLTEWQPIVQIGTPFLQDPRLFSEDEFLVERDRLLRKAAPDKPICHTSIPCDTVARMTVEFDRAWRHSDGVGIGLNLAQGNGYRFLLVPDPKGEDSHVVEIHRGRVRLHSQQFKHSVTAADEPSLKLIASRDGNQLSLRIGSGPAIEFVDVFALPSAQAGVFGVVCPEGVGIRRLRASRKTRAAVPGPSELADAAYLRSDVDQAIDLYRRQAHIGSSAGFRDRARYKAARCLTDQSRLDEALEFLSPLLTNPSDDSELDLLAQCLVWLIHLRRADTLAADIQFDRVASRYDYQQIVRVLPEADRIAFIEGTITRAAGYNLLRMNEDRLQGVERAISIQQLIDPQFSLGSFDHRWYRLRAYHALGEIDKAIAYGDELMALRPILQKLPGQFYEEYAWALRLGDRPQDALRVIDRQMEISGEQCGLLTERARIHIALGDLTTARRDIERSLEPRSDEGYYRTYSAACLLDGWLKFEDGDRKGAQQAWQAGGWSQWCNQHGNVLRSLTGLEALNAMLVGVVAEDLSDDDLQTIVNHLAGGEGYNANLFKGAFRAIFHTAGPAVRNMMRNAETQSTFSTSGKAALRRFVLREHHLAEHMRLPIRLAFVEMIRQGALHDRWSVEMENWAMQFVDAAMNTFLDGAVGPRELALTGITWKRNPALALLPPPNLESFPIEIRSQVQFVLGHRYRQLERWEHAKEMLSQAAEAIPSSQKIRWMVEQAKSELDDLSPHDTEPGL